MQYGNTPETREALIYADLHAGRETHLDAARRARTAQAEVAALRAQARERATRDRWNGAFALGLMAAAIYYSTALLVLLLTCDK